MKKEFRLRLFVGYGLACAGSVRLLVTNAHFTKVQIVHLTTF